MVFDQANEFVEIFKNSFPISFLIFLPLLFIITPVYSVHDFPVYRMQHYDLQGSAYGCRNSLINVEARPLNAEVLTRKCLLSRIKEFSIERLKEAFQQNIAGVLILLPNLESLKSHDIQEHLMDIEQDLLQEETQVPIYLAEETQELLDIYMDVQKSASPSASATALETIIHSTNANGFQLVVSAPKANAMSDFEIVNIQGKLIGQGIEERLPTIIIAAHYDAFGLAPSLSFGADSNGSGVAALFELIRIFSKLYANSRTHANYNLLFLLTGAGKFNYQGTRRWLDDQAESGEANILSDVSLVICLDTIASTDGHLYAHVSKPPKQGSTIETYIKTMEIVGKRMGKKVEIIHKKINLADDYLAWEHERFSIQRLPAITISRLNNSRSHSRNTMLDTRKTINIENLSNNIQFLVEALASHLYNFSDEDLQLFSGSLEVNTKLVESWMIFLTSQPRSAQLLPKDSLILTTFESAMQRYLKEVKKHLFKPDKRDPEVVFYSASECIMNAYSVKPAIFDLFLGLGIALYLGFLYLLCQNFSNMLPNVQTKPFTNGFTKVKKVQ